ncbi:MAG: type II toxin-antitoxin system PemK/MazF family toxin [Thermomicrobiales bacterium]
MTLYLPGDLVLVAFPYAGDQRIKHRPALVILDTGNADVVVARVTTRIHESPHDVTILEWEAAGSLASSVVRLHKVATIEKSLIRRRLGTVRPADRRHIHAVVRQSYGGW